MYRHHLRRGDPWSEKIVHFPQSSSEKRPGSCLTRSTQSLRLLTSSMSGPAPLQRWVDQLREGSGSAIPRSKALTPEQQRGQELDTRLCTRHSTKDVRGLYSLAIDLTITLFGLVEGEPRSLAMCFLNSSYHPSSFDASVVVTTPLPHL